MGSLLQLDRSLFHFLNQTIANPWLDSFMPFITSSATWWGIGLCALSAILWRRKWPWLRIFLLCLLAMGISDVISASVIKPWVGRVRPCHQETVRLITGHCGGMNSFPSNHAANGAAVFVVALFLLRPALSLPIGILALLSGLSRIYLGVHFPSDVLAGFLLGASVGWLVVRISRY